MLVRALVFSMALSLVVAMAAVEDVEYLANMGKVSLCDPTTFGSRPLLAGR